MHNLRHNQLNSDDTLTTAIFFEGKGRFYRVASLLPAFTPEFTTNFCDNVFVHYEIKFLTYNNGAEFIRNYYSITFMRYIEE